jgi:Ca-activated chloride channel family protein
VSFASPFFLVALLVVPMLFGLALPLLRRRTRYPVSFTNVDLLSTVVDERRRNPRRYVPPALLALALLSAASALARPEARVTVSEQNAAIVLLVDVSGSMRANDVEPTRLAAATAAMDTFSDRLPSRCKVGLVAFSGTAQPLLDPTTDRALLREQVSFLQPEGGTALGDGLAAAVTMVQRSLARGGYIRRRDSFVPGAIVLLSDGAQDAGTRTPYQAALEARKAGIRVDGVAFGTPAGTLTVGFGDNTTTYPVPPSPQTVSMVAQVTHGAFYTAETASSAIGVYRKLGSSLGRTKKELQVAHWFAAAAALFLISAVAAGQLLGARIP